MQSEDEKRRIKSEAHRFFTALEEHPRLSVQEAQEIGDELRLLQDECSHDDAKRVKEEPVDTCPTCGRQFIGEAELRMIPRHPPPD